MSEPNDAARLLAHELEPGLLSLDLRLRDLLAEDDVSEAVQACRAEVAALRELVRDYQQWSSTRVDLGPFSLGPVLAALRTRFEPLAQARGLTLDFVATDAEVTGDPQATERILSNLIGNAVAYSPAGRSVQVLVRSEGPTVSIEVADQGIGIAASEQERIFEPFVRLDRERAGSGLGLPLARALAEAQRGTLTLSSELERGSRLLLTLPSK